MNNTPHNSINNNAFKRSTRIMPITWRSHSVCILLLIALAFMCTLAIPTHSWADSSTELTCVTRNSHAALTPGENIVKVVFGTIQTILNKIGGIMYIAIVDNIFFQIVVNAAAGLYIAIYGVMVMLNLAERNLGEITSRLIRIAILYSLLSFGIGGYATFDRYVVQFFLGGMNQLMYDMTAASYGLPAIAQSLLFPYVPIVGNLILPPTIDTAAVSALYPSMNIVFSPFFLVAILGLLTCGPLGWCMAMAIGFAFYAFASMVFGAIITYVRSMVGLTFLFGVAPIFLVFLLFHKTRHIFLGWLNQVVSFAIAPVMLFAFLSFYTLLVYSVLTNMLTGVGFCWVKWFTFAGTNLDVLWWRPAIWESPTNRWLVIAGDWSDPGGVPLPPPINLINIIFFFFVCHLGKNFCSYIGEIANKISEGIGPSRISGSTAAEIMRSQLMSGRGTGASGIGAAFSGGAGKFSGSETGARSLVGKR